MGDLGMSAGLDHDTVLTIGFLNKNVQERLQSFKVVVVIVVAVVVAVAVVAVAVVFVFVAGATLLCHMVLTDTCRKRLMWFLLKTILCTLL